MMTLPWFCAFRFKTQAVLPCCLKDTVGEVVSLKTYSFIAVVCCCYCFKFFFFFMLLSYLAAFATFHGGNYSIFNPWKKIYYEEEGKSRKAAPLLWALPGVVKREGLQQCAVPIPSLQRLHPLPAVQWQEGKPGELEDLFCQALSKHCLLSG